MSHSPPPGQTVIVKSGCGKAALILSIIAGFCFLIVGGCFTVGMYGCGRVMHEVAKDGQVKEQAAANLVLVDFEWEKAGFDNIMQASFAIRNEGEFDLKDIVVEAVHYAPSGTRIDSNQRTIYEVIAAGETRRFESFNMGFIHSQADRSEAHIIRATPVGSDEP